MGKLTFSNCSLHLARIVLQKVYAYTPQLQQFTWRLMSTPLGAHLVNNLCDALRDSRDEGGAKFLPQRHYFYVRVFAIASPSVCLSVTLVHLYSGG